MVKKLIIFGDLAKAYDELNKSDTMQLYADLGWEDLIGKPEWANTCAVRMSLALIACHVSIPGGRMAIKKGPNKGRLVEPSQNRLSDLLEKEVLGPPRKYSNAVFIKGGYQDLLLKTGIASFKRIPSYVGGHIDLIDVRNDWICRRHCYFDATEIWFWQLPS